MSPSGASGHRRLLFHLPIPLNPAYFKKKMNHKEDRFLGQLKEKKSNKFLYEASFFASSFFDLFDMAVKNFSNSGNFAAIGK
jgi:hypothetical protein